MHSRPLLHERFPPLRTGLPHLRLAEHFSPVRPLTGFQPGSAPLWLKDDGAFGTGPWGGNKIRKLEWILADAERRGFATILTTGGLGTNWGLATALYARERGLRTALALVDQPLDEDVEDQLQRIKDSGASVHITHGTLRTLAALPWLVLRHSGQRPPYLLPPGGSSRLGVIGYVEAAFEIAQQVSTGALPEPSHLVVAVGSGGTAAGLALGLRLAGLSTRVVGVRVTDQLPVSTRALLWMARRAERLLARRGAALPLAALSTDDLTVLEGWLGAGYGHASAAGKEAMMLARDQAGLELEATYTAKAFAALLSENAAGRFGEGPVLYVHTHGPRGVSG